MKLVVASVLAKYLRALVRLSGYLLACGSEEDVGRVCCTRLAHSRCITIPVYGRVSGERGNGIAQHGYITDIWCKTMRSVRAFMQSQVKRRCNRNLQHETYRYNLRTAWRSMSKRHNQDIGEKQE
ncbi:hypothetical protein PHLGIDRAFT_173592 [Phlebiopsis gigantea 11061_1 CR5-6]|uniref:Secreted protein n=1 Tax=Phlebiopsis gigantea (strain 11061_1 CR5-6) TaxID=745531 RepID=A0A0C3NZY3_PHLG1|nr:hypothetical protein PHLGIDRAFT_173592 [Phlebiopsis gigantea 11061_1 CR5-6]